MMQNTIPNPYFNLAMIRSSDMFFGRTLLLRRFYGAVANRQSVSLVGPRHIGKSSFLWCASLPEVQNRFMFDLDQHIFIFLDLREFLLKTMEDFFHCVSREIIAQSAKVAGLTLQAVGMGEDEFSNVLDQVVEHGFFPVLLLDAFDRVTLNKHFGPEFFFFLRAQASMGLVSYVTASIAPLYEVCHSGIAGSPFFNIFYNYSLGALTPEEARELIFIPAERAGMPFSEAEVTLVLKLTGGHPFFIQRVCYALFEEKLLRVAGMVDEIYFKSLVYQDLLPHFIDTWERLPEAQRVLLQDESQQKGKQQRELPELSESALFRQFVRDECQIGMFRMTPDELEDALNKIDDPKALGETNLRLMKTVYARLSKDRVLSTVERGMVIREVINKACEQLRGPGVRLDSAPEWRLYNILHYRYLKYHFKADQMANRLGLISVRQYYRERNKAIEGLLNVLLEMEHAVNNDNE